MKNIHAYFWIFLCAGLFEIQYAIQLDFALLEHHLHALNHQLTTAPSQQLAVPITQKSEHQQKLIDFSTENSEIHNLLISSDINNYAPKEVPVKLTPQATLTQIIVAWQGLPFKTFLNLKEQRAIDTIASAGYSNNDAFFERFRTANQHLASQLTSHEEEFKKMLDIDDPLLGGGNASCGYHALKNSLIAAHAIYSGMPHALTRVMDLQLIDDLFGTPEQRHYVAQKKSPGIWRKAVLAQYLEQEKAALSGYDVISDKNGEWLTDEGLTWLWEKKLPQMPDSYQLYKHKGALQLHVYTGETPEFTTFAEQYRSNPNFLGALIIPSAARGGTTASKHWMSLIINKIIDSTQENKNITQFILFDSQNFPRYHDDIVANVIKILLGSGFSPKEQEQFDKQRAAIFEALAKR